MKVITKKLKEEIFVWDPNAFGGKGYWFVLGTKGGYGKAASKKEADKLGKPDLPKETATQETATVSPVNTNVKAVPTLETPPEQAPVTKVIKEVNNTETIIKEVPVESKNKTNETKSVPNVTNVTNETKSVPEMEEDEEEERKVSDYAKAAKVRKTSLSDLITKKIVEGGSIGSSIKAGISEKSKAKVTGIKEAFDPLNIAKKLTGGLGAAILGRATGRKQEDIEYFSGVKPKKDTASKIKSTDKAENVTKGNKSISKALYTKVAEGQKQKVIRGDSVSNVLSKLYNLMKQYHDEDITRLELERKNKKLREDEQQLWHEELIDAILGKKKNKTQSAKKDEKSGFNLLDYLKTALKTAFEFIIKTIKSIFKGILKGIKNIIKATVGVFKKFIEGPIKALKSLVLDAFKKLKNFVAPIIKSAREALEFIGKNFASLARKVGLTSLAEKVEKAITKTEEKAVEKIGAETAEKALAETTEKAGEKVIEKSVVEETEKIAEKTAGKTLLKKIPFLGALAGLAFGTQRAIGGDLTGAALEVASGVVGSVPVVGTAASLGIDAYLAARDFGVVGGESKEEPTATPVEEQPKENTFTETEGGAAIGGMKGVKPKTATIAPTPNATSETQARTGVDLSNKGQRPTMVNDPRLNMAAPTPPQSNPLTEKVQSVINKNNEMKLEQSITPKTTVIDNSKNITAGGGSTTETITTNAVPVRNDEDTWNKLQKLNYRPI